MSQKRRSPFTIDGLTVVAGRRGVGDIPIAKLVTGSQISLPVQIIHGRSEGPTVWLSAAVHGDEIGGVEIVRRVNTVLDPKRMSGTVIAVPIVNVHGFLNGDRYLPDRRDLNRSFPGTANGSLAGRVANLFLSEIVSRCDVGIDLHTGSDHRTNLPQVHADLDDPETRRLAEAFGAPVMLHAKVRDGSLRGAATDMGKTVLLYEGGEAWRFDEQAIVTGTEGVLRVLTELGVTDVAPATDHAVPAMSRRSRWVRARRSGIVGLDSTLGDRVARGQQLGVIHDSVGRRLARLNSPIDGIVIGHVQHPLVNQGDAVIHIAEIENAEIENAEIETAKIETAEIEKPPKSRLPKSSRRRPADQLPVRRRWSQLSLSTAGGAGAKGYASGMPIERVSSLSTVVSSSHWRYNSSKSSVARPPVPYRPTSGNDWAVSSVSVMCR